MSSRLSLNQYVYYDGLIWIVKSIFSDGTLTLYRMHGNSREERWRNDIPDNHVFTEEEIRQAIKR